MGKEHRNSSGTARLPEYLEMYHAEYIRSIKDEVATRKDLSPFSDFTDVDVDTAFFGVGYVLSSFPSLYDMYGKFMAGLDVEYLFNQAFEDTTNGAIVHNLVSEQASILSENLENDVLPRYEVGMRDINAVMSGTFAVGKAMLESKRVRELSRFDAELRYRMIPVALDRWKTHLDWNKQVVIIYAEILKFYFTAVLDVGGYNYEMHTKDILWPFTVYEYEKVALGAVTTSGTTPSIAGVSRTRKVIGGALSGAAAGAMVGAPGGPVTAGVGAAAGAVLGLAGGFLS